MGINFFSIFHGFFRVLFNGGCNFASTHLTVFINPLSSFMLQSKIVLSNIIIALIILSALGVIRFLFNKNIIELLDKFRQKSFSYRQIKEELNVRTTASIVFNVLSYVMLALYAYVIFDFYEVHLPYNKLQTYLLCLAAAPLAIVMKRFLVLFVGGIFNINHLTKNYLFYFSMSRKVTGILLAAGLSFYFAFHHQEYVKAISFYFICLLLLGILIFTFYKIIQSLVKNSSFRFSLHFFLYLCAIEILPVVLTIKKITGSLS